MSGRFWIAERCSRARTTILIEADSKQEAQLKLASGEFECVYVSYYDIGVPRIIREDKSKSTLHTKG